jgi:hypothetical protein
MDNDAAVLAQIDTQIEQLRQARLKDETDPRCAEIDANITHGLGYRGENVNVQDMRERWDKNKVYTVAPQGVQVTLHLLIRAAQHAQSPEVVGSLLAKIEEVLEWTWPTSTPREMTIIKHEQVEILLPKL